MKSPQNYKWLLLSQIECADLRKKKKKKIIASCYMSKLISKRKKINTKYKI
jgi:hypothetical protein